MVKVNFDALKKSKNIGNQRGWKPQAGRNTVRVLPPGKDYIDKKLGGQGKELERLDVSFRSHFFQPEGADLQVFRCPRDLDQKCPACEFFFAHRESPDAAIAKVAKRLNNSLRFLLNVVDVKEPDKGVQPYETGPMVRNQILGIVADGDYGICVDPGAEGRDFYITLTPGNESKSGYNSYETNPGPDKYSIIEKLPDGWVDQLDGLEGMIAETRSLQDIQSIVDQVAISVGLEPSGPVTRSAPKQNKSVAPPETQEVAPPATQEPGPTENKSEPEPEQTEPEPEPDVEPEVPDDDGEESGDDEDDVQAKLDALFGG